MGFESKARSTAEGVAAAALTGALMYAGNGLEPRWPLVWVAPLPVLWFALRSGWGAAALAAGVGWMAGTLNLWGYFRLLELPPLAWAGAFGEAAVVFAGAVLLWRALVLRRRVWTGLVALPAVWTSFEYVRNLLWPHGTSGCLAYSQLAWLPFLQLASVTGPWGMGFVLLLLPSGVAIALYLSSRAPRQALRVAAAAAGTLAAVLLFGCIRLAIRQPGPEVRVRLAAVDRNVEAPGRATQELLATYAAAVRQTGAEAVVLPEKLGTVTDGSARETDAVLERTAEATGATIVAGVDYEGASVAWNEARVYRPEMDVARYDKQHLLPPFELKFTPGKKMLLLHRAEGVWAVAICKDMDFTGLSRSYGKAGVGLMLVPGWDFNIDRGWHGHLAVMRGVEDGFSVVRAAKNGYLTVSDGRGRIVAERRSDAAPLAVLTAEVASGHSGTLFLLLGDWFAWVSTGLVGVSLLRLAGGRDQQDASDTLVSTPGQSLVR